MQERRTQSLGLAPPAIMVVDDEPDIRELIRDVLESRGFDVITAIGGREAIASLGLCHVDLLIIDLVMPEQEGIETIGMACRLFPKLKILAISGSEALYLRMARMLGAQETLEKPFSVDVLITKVEDLLASPAEIWDQGYA
jgi:DNA-binding response OmpR family regulator